MRYVNRVVRPNGQVELYLRKKGLPSFRLTSAEGSAELEREVEAMIAALQPARVAPGTLLLALRRYELESPDFRNLAESTKYEYRLLLNELTDTFGHMPIVSFTPAFLQRARDTWSKKGHRAANVRMQVLRNVLRPALIANGVTSDPFAFIPEVRRPATSPEPHGVWPAHVVTLVIETAIAERRFGLARAVAIARYAGVRRGDLVKLPRSARKDGRLMFLSGKRRVPVDIPEDPQLTSWLDQTPETQPLTRWQAAEDLRKGVTRLPATTLVYNRSSERYTEDGVGQELAKLIGKLHREKRLQTADFDFHGLRHTRGVEAALAGCTDAQGAALLGHGSPNSFAQYRRQADRIRMSDDAHIKITNLREQDRNRKVQRDCNESATSTSGTK